MLKNTVTTGVGVLSTAVAGTDYVAPGTVAPLAAKYIVQQSNSDLTNEQSLGALATGLLKNTTTTGVLSIAVAGTDYVAPSALDELIDDRVGSLLVAGNLITLTYNDAGNSLTIAASGGISGSGTTEQLAYWTGASALGGAPIYYDVSNNRIGIKDSTPSYDLDVNATIRATSGISAGSPATIAAGGQMRAQGRIQNRCHVLPVEIAAKRGCAISEQ